MREKIRLGLDLQGGTHLVLQVVTDDAIQPETDSAIESVRAATSAKATSSSARSRRSQIDEFQAVGVDPNKDADFRRILTDHFPEWDSTRRRAKCRIPIPFKLKPQVAADIREQAVDQAIQTIRNRIDELGVGEVNIQKHGGPGEHEILVQLPGVDDPARVKNIIKSTALLELKLVETGPFPSQAAAAQSYGGVVPGHLELCRRVSADRRTTVLHITSCSVLPRSPAAI